MERIIYSSLLSINQYTFADYGVLVVIPDNGISKKHGRVFEEDLFHQTACYC